MSRISTDSPRLYISGLELGSLEAAVPQESEEALTLFSAQTRARIKPKPYMTLDAPILTFLSLTEHSF